jgi:hypothetical protein
MSDLDVVFQQLRRIMLECAPDFPAAKAEEGELSLNVPVSQGNSSKAEWFGAVAIKKNYVAYHLFPLYQHPSLGEAISKSLQTRRQGKSCFNFKVVDEVLFEELARLTAQAAHMVMRG